MLHPNLIPTPCPEAASSRESIPVWDGSSVRVPGSLGFSQFVGSLSNSMHVLMKHCWPAAHCQLHCCLDDWSIEGLRAFVIPPPCSDSSSPSPSPFSLSLALQPPATGSRFVSFRFESSPGIVIHVRRTSGEGRFEAYISMLENVQNNVQEPPVHFFQRCTPGVRRSTPDPPLRASRTSPARLVPRRQKEASLAACPTPLVIPVDSFQFRIYRDLSPPPPSSTTRRLLKASSPPSSDSLEGSWTNEDRTGVSRFHRVSVCPLLSFAPPIPLSLPLPLPFLSFSLS